MEQNNTLLGLVLFIAATLYTINLVKRRKRREKKTIQIIGMLQCILEV